MNTPRDWQDMAFFCLHWLRMSPEQVAVMLEPDDKATQHIWTIYLRERYAHARRYAIIAQLAS